MLIFWGLFLLLSLVTYDAGDPSFNQVVSQGAPVHNGAGLVGAHLGGLLVEFFGLGAYAWPLGFVIAGLQQLIAPMRFPWWRWAGLVLLSLCVTTWGASEWASAHVRLGDAGGGGFVGRALHGWSAYYLRPTGALLVWLFLFISAVQLLTGATWASLYMRLRSRLADLWRKHTERLARRRKRPAKAASPPREATVKPAGPALELTLFENKDAPAPAEPKARKTPAPKPRQGPDVSGKERPDLDLLEAVPEQTHATPPAVLEQNAQSLSASLTDFNVQGEVQNISPGPVVTMFEYKPAPGVKISRIAGLSDDLALALKASSVRIEAPLPGKDTVGIEVPNDHRQTVYLREIIDSDAFAKSEGKLTMALGKDISGRPFAADLARMPHLLVAGATGAGKSVCINSILLSFLYKATPEQVKLLLVDPKRIELAVYADLPHLVHPVVTEMSQAKNALDWAVHEMDQRYEAMAKLAVRNIEGYNKKLATMKPEDLPEGAEGLEPLPYLVIVIDELADLMLTAAKEVEVSVVRLAQLARAAGIHMILATQRPSVDVVTGLIKANFPCRISFQVTSKHDSRTILDQVGAEHLLGKGDMLFKPSGGKLRRMHGAFVSDEDVAAVTAFWKAKQKPSYRVDFAEWGEEGGADGVLEGEPGAMDNDPMYRDAVEFVSSQGKASISLIQRRFRIGFNKAARFIEQMEADGIIGPAEGSKPRPVLKGTE